MRGVCQLLRILGSNGCLKKKKKKGQVGQSLFFNSERENIHGFTKQEFGNESSIMS